MRNKKKPVWVNFLKTLFHVLPYTPNPSSQTQTFHTQQHKANPSSHPTTITNKNCRKKMLPTSTSSTQIFSTKHCKNQKNNLKKNEEILVWQFNLHWLWLIRPQIAKWQMGWIHSSHDLLINSGKREVREGGGGRGVSKLQWQVMGFCKKRCIMKKMMRIDLREEKKKPCPMQFEGMMAFIFKIATVLLLKIQN